MNKRIVALIILLVVIVVTLTSCDDEKDIIKPHINAAAVSGKFSVRSDLKGLWCMVGGNSEVYLAGRTDYLIDEVENNLIRLSYEDDATKNYYVRYGSQAAKVKFKLSAAKKSNVAKKNRKSGYSGVAGIGCLIKNLNDSEDTHDIVTDQNGEGLGEGLISSNYSVVIEETDEYERTEVQASIIGEKNIGTITPSPKDQYSFRTTLQTNEKFIYGDKTVYSGTVVVENIGSRDAMGVQYAFTTVEGSYISLLDTDTTDFEGIIQTIEPGVVKHIPILFQTDYFSDHGNESIFINDSIAIELKTVEINEETGVNSVVEWVDSVNILIYKSASYIVIGSSGPPVNGFLIFPDHSLHKFATRYEVLRVPYRPDEYYRIMVANVAATQECSYYIAVSSIPPGMDVLKSFRDLTRNEPDNDEENASTISGGEFEVSYLLKDDLDYYVIDMAMDGKNSTPVHPAYHSHVIYDGQNAELNTSGNNDGVPTQGETSRINVAISNLGGSAMYGVTAVLSTDDEYITVDDVWNNSNENGMPIGDIPSNMISDMNGYNAHYYHGNSRLFKRVTGDFLFTIADNVPDNHIATFVLTLTDMYGHKSVCSFFLEIKPISASMKYSSSLIYDYLNAAVSTSGNGDNILNPGESTLLNVAVTNEGPSTVNGIVAEVYTEDAYVIITEGTDPNSNARMFGNIGADSVVDCNGNFFVNLFRYPGDYFVSVSDDAPVGHEVEFTLIIKDMYGNVWTDLFVETIQ